MNLSNNLKNNFIIFLLLVISIFIYKFSFNQNKANSNDFTNTSTNQIKKLNTHQRNTASIKKTISPINTNIQTPPKSDHLTDNTETDRFNKALASLISKNHIDREPAAKSKFKISLKENELLKNTPWKILENARVSRKKLSNWIFKINNLYIYEATNETSDFSNFNTSKPIIVYNERLKRPGIATGVLKINTANKERLKAEIQNHQAEISDEFENVQMYFIKSINPLFNLTDLHKTLSSKDYINSIELEILETNYEKN